MTPMDRRINVAINILDKEFLVACAENEQEQLVASAAYLSNKITEIKDSGKIMGGERIAILAALNMANELLSLKRENSEFSTNVERIIAISDKIESAVADLE